MDSKLELLLNDADQNIKSITKKVIAGERINDEEGLYLFENADLPTVGALANFIRNKKHGDNTYFNRNFHMEPTNVLVLFVLILG